MPVQFVRRAAPGDAGVAAPRSRKAERKAGGPHSQHCEPLDWGPRSALLESEEGGSDVVEVVVATKGAKYCIGKGIRQVGGVMPTPTPGVPCGPARCRKLIEGKVADREAHWAVPSRSCKGGRASTTASMANSMLVASAGETRQLDAMRGDLLPALEQRSQQRAGTDVVLSGRAPQCGANLETPAGA
jgi:hypothetical protein